MEWNAFVEEQRIGHAPPCELDDGMGGRMGQHGWLSSEMQRPVGCLDTLPWHRDSRRGEGGGGRQHIRLT